MKSFPAAFVVLFSLIPSALPAPAQSRVLELNGFSDYAVSIITSGFSPNELTVEAWIRPVDVFSGGSRREQRVLAKGSETFQSFLDGWFSLVYIEDGNLGAPSGIIRFNVYLGGAFPTDQVQLDSSVPYGPEQWLHVAGTYSRFIGRASLYVNGILDNSTTTSLAGTPLVGRTMTSSPQPLSIGAVPLPNAVAATAFRGQVDEVRLWSVARSPADILANAVNELSSGVGLIDAWHFDGNANGGTFMGLAFGASSFPVAFVPGVGGGRFPPQRECQVPQGSATFGVGGFSGNGSAPAFSNAWSGAITFASPLSGNIWEIGITVSQPPVPLFAGGIRLPDGQILNLDLASPGLLLLNGGTFTVPFLGNLTLPYAITSPGGFVSGQMLITDPATPTGVRLSNPAILAPGW